jgi:hypothetical protein
MQISNQNICLAICNQPPPWLLGLAQNVETTALSTCGEVIRLISRLGVSHG